MTDNCENRQLLAKWMCRLGNAMALQEDGTYLLNADLSDVVAETYQDGSFVDSVKTFNFANNDAANSAKEVYIAGAAPYPREHLLSIYNPSTETDLTVTVLRYNSLLKAYTQLTQLSYPKQPARVDPTKVLYYDASADSYTDVTAAFTNATANDVSVPGHASAEVGDTLWIGHTTPFHRIYLNVGTARTDQASYAWKYSKATNGTITDVDDKTINGSVSGLGGIRVKTPSDWATKDIGSQGTAYYYLGLECTAAPTPGTQGLITQGKILTTTKRDVMARPVQFLNEADMKLIIQNDTVITNGATIAGVGAFQGEVSLMRV